MTRRGSELNGQHGRPRASNGVVFALVSISVALFVMFFRQGDHARAERNPHPKLDYEVLVNTNGAPEPLTSGSIRVTYSASETEPKACYYTDPFIGAPTNRPEEQIIDYPLQAVGEHLYRAVIHADAFQDSVYQRDYPPCHWVINFITAALKGKNQNFDIDMGRWDPPEAREYFPKEPDKEQAKAGLNAGGPSRDLLYVPMPDIWTAQMKIAPISAQTPQLAAVAAWRSPDLPPSIFDPTAYRRDPSAYQKMQEAVEKMAKAGEAIQAVRSDDSGGALVIVGPADNNGPSTTPRRLVIMAKDDTGNLVPIAQNDRVIPCGNCEDVLNDTASMLRPIGSPFIKRAFRDDYLNSKLHGFQVFMEGGARLHWWRIYTFVHPADRNDWMLFAAELGIMDTDTGVRREIDLTTKDFGAIKFEDFDPDALQKPRLP